VLKAEAAPGAVSVGAFAMRQAPPHAQRGTDAGSLAWVEALSGAGHRHDEAVAALHALLLRAARFEVARRGGGRSGDLDDLATQSADDALMAIMRKLGTYRGESRFTTWAYKFALLEAGVKARKRAWQNREVPLEADGWAQLAGRRSSPDTDAESAELIAAVCDGISEALTPHQRRVLVALTLNDVPIDVLAERLGTTRGALYKTLHDARRKLRARLEAAGLALESTTQRGRS
jgi:RNA polymerase sigma-70 factor, ECF subfamily